MIRRVTLRLKQVFKIKPAPVKRESPLANVLLKKYLFDSKWYINNYPEVSKNEVWLKRPIIHYLEKGMFANYQPNIWFDPAGYVKEHKDVAQSGVNPLLHFIDHGISEKRTIANDLQFLSQLPAFAFFNLNEFTINFTLPILEGFRKFNISLLYQQYERPLIDKPCGIFLVSCFDVKGDVVKEGVKGLIWSDHLQSWYRYLNQKSLDRLDIDEFIFQFPAQVIHCNISIKPWNDSAFQLRNKFKLKVLDEQKLLPHEHFSLLLKNTVTSKELKVALIADEFTYNSFKDEFNAIVLEPDTWREQFEANKPDIFFCESAWSGADSKRRPWKGKIYASVNFARENRTILLEILAYCRQKGIPTLFWNKEDPTHYPDRKHDFVKTAALFDYVFTSAAECVAQYKQDYGLKQVFALPFATNPRLFNPFEQTARSNKVVFAGSWYANHIERSQVMEQILDSLIANGYEPEIYDRYYGDPDPLHIWPEKYLPYIKAGQPHDQMPTVYKSSTLGLNFNTVTESSTMFARRVFELMSSNTLVISNYSKGVAEMFGDLVVFADHDPERLGQLSQAESDVIREQALQRVLTEHTYAKRWRYMLDCIGFKVKADNHDVTLVSRISNDNQAMSAISYFEQHYGRKTDCRLLLVISSQVADIDVAAFYQKYNRFGITVTAESFMQKHALEGKYRPVETPYFMLFHPNQAPAAYWLDKAKLHLSYLQEQILTPYQLTPYQLETVNAESTVAGRVEQFLSVYQSAMSSQSQLAYGV